MVSYRWDTSQFRSMIPCMALLNPAKDAKGISTGFFECSLCGELFKPNPSKPLEMQITFNQHLEKAHPLPGPAQPLT